MASLLKSLLVLPLRAHMKRASRGLFAGKDVMFGNNVSFSERKTRRKWLPNVQKKTFFSEILNRSITLNTTTSAMRWVDKAGGFDKYILKTSDKKLDSAVGCKLKREMHEHLKSAKANNRSV